MEYPKMTNKIPNITLINAETGLEETRVMTSEEFNLWKESADRQNELQKTKEAEAEAKAIAKAALLERMGLTADEAVLLLS
jgi:hypothetical protein